MEPHPSLEDLVAAIDGRLTSAERTAIDAHLAACATCRAEFVEVSVLAQSAPAVVTSRRRWLPAAGLVAAAALAIAVALPSIRRPPRNVDPADQRATANASIVPIVSPSDAAVRRDSLRLTWRAATAASYRVIITDSTGTELYSAATPETTVVLPTSVVLNPGARYFWFVDELRADGTSLGSHASSFSIRP